MSMLDFNPFALFVIVFDNSHHNNRFHVLVCIDPPLRCQGDVDLCVVNLSTYLMSMASVLNAFHVLKYFRTYFHT